MSPKQLLNKELLALSRSGLEADLTLNSARIQAQARAASRCCLSNLLLMRPRLRGER